MGFLNFGHNDRRKHERIPTLDTASAFGQVMDLSESGACLFRKGTEGCRIGDTVQLDIRQGSLELKISATVARIEELGFKRFEVGVAFESVTSEQYATIRTMQRMDVAEIASPQAFVEAA